MADKVQVIAQIRFALEQLSERNAEHDWEHLCRYFAQARICSNILPATGPVQSGGDQGRDFETFHTFLRNSKLNQRSFVGLISEKPLAFACTLEKKVQPKIRDDVKIIMSSGELIEGIYVFCTQDVPVGQRHKLQAWARSNYDISLEILDGASVAELLCDRELFWLAERYLQLPTELLPTETLGEESQDWYARTLHKWQREARPALTFIDFVEIRAASRIALGPFAYDDDGHPVDQYARTELPFWIDRLDEFVEQDVGSLLSRRALYEASVLRLRGLGSLIGQEEQLRRYFGNISKMKDAADLEDVEVLLMYILTANKLGRVVVERAEFQDWLQKLELCVDKQLGEASGREKINERCALLEVRGSTAFLRSLYEGTGDATDALNYWGDLVQLVVKAPLFPLERFSARIVEYARYFGEHPNYAPLAEAVDAALGKRFGQFKVAENCLERAKAFREAGNLPLAMAQLHRAKVDWFAEETLAKSLQALDWLSLAYLEQGLFFAAKYYALASAYVLLNAKEMRLKVGIARCLERAASCDYALGAWHGFLELATVIARFYPNLVGDPRSDFNRPDSILQYLMLHVNMIPAITNILYPELRSFAYEHSRIVAQRLNLEDALSEIQSTVETEWADLGPQQMWETVEEQLAGPPWSDAGPARRATWRAFGISWNVQWPNDYETTIAAEAFLCVLQIFLSDLSGYDLCLLPSRLNISLRLAASDVADKTVYKGFDVQFERSNKDRSAVVSLPSYRTFADGSVSFEDLQIGAVAITSSLLAEVSLLPTKRFDEILNARFAQGLHNKIFVGASYGQCVQQFVKQEDFVASDRSRHILHGSKPEFVPHKVDALPWVNGLGPGYGSDNASSFIRNRYINFSRPILRTLQRLAKEPEFQATVAELRSTGWKDWHILSAVFHATMNYRLDNHVSPLQYPEDEAVATRRLMNEPESVDAVVVPLSEYRKEELQQQILMYLIVFAKTFGLEIHQLTPDFPAIEDFLAKRYNFWTDDVEHDNPFKLN